MTPEPQLFLPAARSTLAPGVDGLFDFISYMSLLMFLLIVGAVGYFVWKFRRKPGDVNQLSTPTFHSIGIELFWSVGPLLVCFGLFHWGVKQYLFARVAPSDAIAIKVRAQKWSWEFEYPSGRISGELHVPVNTPVKLIMTSKDVIHSFFIPDFRVKQDVLPGRYSMVWFQATAEGTDQIFCTEYCGMSHSNMLAKAVVESMDSYKKYIDYDPYEKMAPEQIGSTLFTEKACTTCHSLDGSQKPGGGPSWKGLYGRQETMSDGTVVSVDDAYITESILNPGAKIVKGYQNIMPSFQGSLKPKEIAGLIAFIKTQK